MLITNILQWLPNQLSAVMDLMISIYDTYLKDNITATDAESGQRDKLDFVAAYKKQLVPMMEQVHDQREKLAREVERWCKERGA